MLIPAFIALLYGDGGGKAFLQAFFMSSIIGIFLWWTCHKHKEELRARDGFLIVVAFWLVLGTLGSVPFLLFEQFNLTLPDALFESFSGLTTTGATVLTGLDYLPKSVLFYRQFLQWLGGMGIIVLAVAIIPLLGIGGTQLYQAESSGPFKNEKLRPRIAEVAKLLWLFYCFLTIACALAYWFAGMTAFDAIGHSFSTVANGGFSTHDASLAYFDNYPIYLITTVFMLIGGCSFNLHILALSHFRKQSFLKTYVKNTEFRFYFMTQFVFIMLFSIGLYVYYADFSLVDAFVKGSLQLSSMSMTAGYTIFDFETLPSILVILLIFSSIIGGSAASTTGGLKAVRVLILWLQTKRELLHLIHPNLVQPIKLGHHIIPNRVLENIWSFLMIFIIVFWVCVFASILCGMETFDAIAAVLATLTNAGPGLGMIHQNFADVPDSAKLVFSFAMVCGRLEFFSLLVLFSPAFWKE
ncbi:potassium transporter [[Haemophilus] felis]|nr:potassium transporter [[Haemophilus] felis]